MPRGGARPGSGPKPNPNSQRQKKLAEKARRDALKSGGASSPAPATATTAPAKAPPAKKTRAKKEAATTKPSSAAVVALGHRFGKLPRGGFTGRVPAWPLATPATTEERDAWKSAWRTPQAAAWATEPWRWRTVALWVRSAIRCEAPDVAAAILSATSKLADQIGLTPAGLLANGWEIEEAPGSRVAVEPPAPTPAPGPQSPPPSIPSSGVDPRDRLKIVDGSSGR